MNARTEPGALLVSINEAQAILRRAPAGSEFHFHLRVDVCAQDGSRAGLGIDANGVFLENAVYNYIDVSKQHMLRVLRTTGDAMVRRGSGPAKACVHLTVLPKSIGRGNDYWL